MDNLSVVMTFIYSSLALVGIIGNVLVIVVVVNVKSMRTATNCYLVSLAISDSLFFISALPSEILNQFQHNSYAFGQLGCMLQIFITYLSMNTSSLSVAAFSVERFIGICFPMRAWYSCTVRRACFIVACIWAFSICYNSPWLYMATIVMKSENLNGTIKNVTACHFRFDRNSNLNKVIYVGDILVFYVLPMVLYVFLYTRIAKALRNRVPSTRCQRRSTKRGPVLRNKKHMENSVSMTPNADYIPIPNGHQCVTTTAQVREAALLVNSGKVSKTGSEMSRATRRSITSIGTTTNDSRGASQVVKMLAVVTLLFAVLWMPYKGMVLYNSFASHSWSPAWFINMAKTAVFVNAAINPMLYNLMSTKFRSAFVGLLLSKRIPQRTVMNDSDIIGNSMASRFETRMKSYRDSNRNTHSHSTAE